MCSAGVPAALRFSTARSASALERENTGDSFHAGKDSSARAARALAAFHRPRIHVLLGFGGFGRLNSMHFNTSQVIFIEGRRAAVLKCC